MPDEAQDNQAPQEPQAKGGSKRKMQLIIVAILMIGEGVGIYFVANALSPVPPASVAGAGGADDAESATQPDYAEIELAECRPSNKVSGKFISFHLRVSALVDADKEEESKKLVSAKRARIRDRVNFVIRSVEPKHLNEPGLETIKRRIKFELSRLFDNPELIRDVLIPEMLQSNAGV